MRARQARRRVQPLFRRVGADHWVAVLRLVSDVFQRTVLSLRSGKQESPQRPASKMAEGQPGQGTRPRSTATAPTLRADAGGCGCDGDYPRQPMLAMSTEGRTGHRPRPHDWTHSRPDLRSVQHATRLAGTPRRANKGGRLPWLILDQPCHADVLLEIANGVPDA